MRNLGIWITAAVLLVAAACSDDTACTPGALQTCPCPGGEKGVQKCSANGETWGDCSGCTSLTDQSIG